MKEIKSIYVSWRNLALTQGTFLLLTIAFTDIVVPLTSSYIEENKPETNPNE